MKCLQTADTPTRSTFHGSSWTFCCPLEPRSLPPTQHKRRYSFASLCSSRRRHGSLLCIFVENTIRALTTNAWTTGKPPSLQTRQAQILRLLIRRSQVWLFHQKHPLLLAVLETLLSLLKQPLESTIAVARPSPWEQPQGLVPGRTEGNVQFFVLIFALSAANVDVDWFRVAPLGPDVHLVLPARVGLHSSSLHLLGSELCGFYPPLPRLLVFPLS